MNTVSIPAGDGEVQEYDDLSGFSPLDSCSAWEVYAGSAGDLGATIFRKDHEFLDSKSAFADEDVANSQWSSSSAIAVQQSSSAAPAAGCRRSIRDILREVKVSEETLRSAVARLGGGAQGLQALMDLVHFWASSEAHDADVTATIRKGILDLGNNMRPHHSAFNAHLHWNHSSNRGTTGYEPTHHGPAYTRALRKSHIVRQRRHRPRAQRMSKNQEDEHHSRGQWRNAAPRQSWMRDDLDPELGHDAKGKGYEFLFQKELRASDVSSLGRIVLPKKDAERYLPFLIVREGMMLSFEDYQSGTLWTVRYRFWPNNKSRMYLLENIGGFVTFHGLQEGDFLLCYRNAQGGYVIRAWKVPADVRDPAKGPTLRGNTQETESTETTETEIVTTTTTQFVDGDQSTTNTTDTISSFGSFECSFGEGPPNRLIGRQRSPEYRCITYEDDVLKTGEFYQDVEMLSASNVKRRFIDGDEPLLPE